MVSLALCGANLERQTRLAKVSQGVVWLRRTIPLDRRYILAFVALDRELLAPEVETVRRAEVVVDALAFGVCVAQMQRRFGGP